MGDGLDTLYTLLEFQGDFSGLEDMARRSTSTPAEPTDVLAIDCEMITTEQCSNRVARCSVVNMYGYVILDVYVDPGCKVLNYRTRWSGITRSVIKQARAEGNLWSLRDLQNELENLFHGRTIVGHSVRNDFNALGLSELLYINAIDTQKYPGGGKKRGLKNLLQGKFGISIQDDNEGHSSVEDACGAMLLYRAKQYWFDQRVFSY